MFFFIPAGVFCEENNNLLQNPGFEELGDDGLPTGWYTDAYITREGVSEYLVTTEAYEGSHSVYVVNQKMNDARFAQTVEVKPNTMYRLSGWVKADHIPDAGRGANLSVSGVYAFSQSLFDTKGEWVYIETYGITGPKQNELTVFARVGGYSGESEGGAAFDDLSLEVVTDLPAGVKADIWYVAETVQVIEPIDAGTSTTEAQPFWPQLLLIAAAYAVVGIWGMRHFQLDRSEMKLSSDKNTAMPGFAIVGLLVAALSRFAVAFFVDGYQVDVNCFTSWGYTMAEVGPSLFYQTTTWCDYTPGYIYIMGLNGIVSKLVSGLVRASVVHKLLPMACDLIGSWIVFRLAVEHKYDRRQAGLYALLFAFNPATFLNSAAWCQIDSVLCVGLMLVAYFAIHRKWAVVLPIYVLCILIKPQALMLGFLGLTALILEWISTPADNIAGKEFLSKPRKDMLIGLGISVVVALLVILPFSPNQSSPLWLFKKYAATLKSYPHATLNTANIFYLFDGNWDGIENPAAAGACVFFALASFAWSLYTTLCQKKRNLTLWYAEPFLTALYGLLYVFLAITGCTWGTLGVLTMSMAFVLVLPMYIRSGKLENLALCGAVLFLLLYVFGIKMHERYLFPAIFLLGMAYAIRRDRRILTLLISASCVLFVNEGVILDNSLRLGSSMGHLNADNVVLADCLSVLNIAAALAGVWVCHRVCVQDAPVHLTASLHAPFHEAHEYSQPPATPMNYRPDSGLRIKRLDCVLMLAVTLIYSVVTLTTLGSTKAPQTAWKSSSKDERVYIDLGQHYTDFSMLYFGQVSYYNFSISVADSLSKENDAGSWSEEYAAEMREGLCFSWQYLDQSYVQDGTAKFVNATDFASVMKLSGRYVRINPQQAGLVLNEIIFKDAEGNIIPGVKIVGRENANEASRFYSEPAHLLDEQDTLEGEPSWWNSTYFDEIYHARTAFEHLNRTTAYEWTHPPLGKIMMSWFIGLFGMTPFGWRFAGALAGILMLPAMYLLVKQLTKRTDMAFVGMMLMTLDCMHFTQTRLATIDSYPVLFIILSYFFMLRFMQKDIVLEDMKKLLPDLALCGFFMGCGVASKWIGVYAGIGLGVLYFWTCIRHLRMARMADRILSEEREELSSQTVASLNKRSKTAFRRFVLLCLWCILFFVAVPLAIYLWSYTVHYAYLEFDTIGDFLHTVINCQVNILDYHSTPRLGMDHDFYSPWYEWPLMMKPMYYASASFKPEGMSYAIFCFGNPWVWVVGLMGIAYTVFHWLCGHRYVVSGCDGTLRIFRSDWDITPAFVLIGLLAQFLPWVLVPRGTYIYHYFASVPFLILGTVLLIHHMTQSYPERGCRVWIIYLLLCFVWFVILFPYASGLTVPVEWLDVIRDYPYLTKINNYWNSDLLVNLNSFLEKIPIFPYVYHH